MVTCPGIFPMIFTVLWRRQSQAAAILSPILGLATGLAVWLSTASHFGGAVSVATTGEVLPCVYGTVASCFSPILYSVLITLVRPQNYDWNEFKKEKLALEKLESDLTTVHHEAPARVETSSIEEGGVRSASLDAQELKRWGRIAAFWSAATFLGHWVLWPLPMYGSHYVFEKKVCWLPCSLVRGEKSGSLTRNSSISRGLWWASSGCGPLCLSPHSIRSSMVGCSRLCRSIVDSVGDRPRTILRLEKRLGIPVLRRPLLRTGR